MTRTESAIMLFGNAAAAAALLFLSWTGRLDAVIRGVEVFTLGVAAFTVGAVLLSIFRFVRLHRATEDEAWRWVEGIGWSCHWLTVLALFGTVAGLTHGMAGYEGLDMTDPAASLTQGGKAIGLFAIGFNSMLVGLAGWLWLSGNHRMLVVAASKLFPEPRIESYAGELLEMQVGCCCGGGDHRAAA